MKRLLAALLCLCLLAGCMTALAEAKKAEDVTPKANVTDDWAPEISDIKFTENKKTLKPGDKIHLSAKITDNTGVRNAVAVFSIFKGDDVYYYSLDVQMEYDGKTDRYTGETELSKELEKGTYHLYRINAYDVYGNEREIWSDYGNKKLGTFKFAPSLPKVKAKVTISGKKTVKPAESVKLTVKPSKTIPATWAEVKFYNAAEDYYTYGGAGYDEESKTFTGQFSFGWKDETGKIHNDCPSGEYEVTEVSFYSPQGDLYSRATVSGVKITLKNGAKPPKNNKSPKISSGKIDKKGKTVGKGTKVHVTAKVKDSDGLMMVQATLANTDYQWEWDNKLKASRTESHQSAWVDLTNTSGSTWEGDITLPDTMVNGTYMLNIWAEDKKYGYSYKEFPKMTVTFSDADVATWGMKSFVSYCNSSFEYPLSSEEEEALATKMAERKAKGVDAVYEIAQKSSLSDAEKIARAAEFMTQGAKTTTATELKAAIGELAATPEFKELCANYEINAGSLTQKKVSTITLNKKKLSLKVGKSVTLKATVEPADAANKKLVWSSSNEYVAKVSKKGKVTAVNKGECTITCKSKDGGARIKIKVKVK